MIILIVQVDGIGNDNCNDNVMELQVMYIVVIFSFPLFLVLVLLVFLWSSCCLVVVHKDLHLRPTQDTFKLQVS